MKRLACLPLLLLLASCQRAPAAPAFESGTWIDLSYEFSSETIYWPTAKTFELQVESALKEWAEWLEQKHTKHETAQAG